MQLNSLKEQIILTVMRIRKESFSVDIKNVDTIYIRWPQQGDV